MLNYIKQRFDWDCGIAALAMATHMTYDSASNALGDPKDAINELHIDNWLGDNGYAWARKFQFVQKPPGYETYGRDNYTKRDPWPCTPFAPTHIALVEATAGAHFITLDGTGAVYDPWKEERKLVTHPDYKRFSWVQGIYRVSHLVPRPITELGIDHLYRDYDDGPTLDLST